MPPVGFEPTIPPSERPQTYALDRAATGTGTDYLLYSQNSTIQPYFEHDLRSWQF